MTDGPGEARGDRHDDFVEVARRLGEGPLTEERVRDHLFPLFTRVLGREEIYLANHSLGRPPDRMARDVAGALDLWYSDMDGAWEAWLGEQRAYRANIARLIGHGRPDGVVPKVSAGQGLRAVLNALPRACPQVVTTRGEFDSVDWILKTYQQRGRAKVRWAEPDSQGLYHASDLLPLIEEGADLVIVSQVCFVTGQVLEGLDRIIEEAHRRGAMVLVDMYHSAGAMPAGFDELGADFAIGGNYKYTRGGPGAGWLAISGRMLDKGDLVPLDTGWFARRDVFSFARDEKPDRAPGGDGWLESTPMILPLYQAKAGLELTLALGVERLYAYNQQQQAFLADALRERGVKVREIEPRGAFLLLPRRDAPEASAKLREAGVNTDARTDRTGQGYVRLCPDVLNTREEMTRAAEIISIALKR